MKTPTIATISVLIAGCSSISPPPPEPYDEKPNVKVEYFRESEWKHHADDVVVGSTDIDFSTIEINYKIEKWEKTYFTERGESIEDIKEYKRQDAYHDVLWDRFAIPARRSHSQE